MKGRTVFIILSVFSFLVLTSVYAAQRSMQWKGSGGWGAGSLYNRMYNPNTVATISGEVISIDTFTPRGKGMSYGVHMVVKTDKEEISIHLGPRWYIENQDVKIEPRDQVEVKGSRVTLNGKPIMIAAEVKKGEETLVLRDTNGFPVWSGWRRR